MKKILIFYASYGGGHLSAANSIKQYIDDNFSDFDTKLIDCMLYVNKPINKITTTAYKEEAVRKFKAHEIKVLICHPASVGMGKNFTEAHVAIYYSLNDSWELFKQSCERIAGHIAVQPKQCEYYIILAENTINELV